MTSTREQKAWYWYDWANSAYFTTVMTVMFAPYLISVAEEAAVDDRVQVLGLSLAPGSLPAYIITFTTILSAVLLPPLGAAADRTANKKGLLAGLAWVGSAFAALLFFCSGDNWQIGAVAAVGANLCFAGSVVVNESTDYFEGAQPFGGAGGPRTGWGRVGGQAQLRDMTDVRTMIVRL